MSEWLVALAIIGWLAAVGFAVAWWRAVYLMHRYQSALEAHREVHGRNPSPLETAVGQMRRSLQIQAIVDEAVRRALALGQEIDRRSL